MELNDKKEWSSAMANLLTGILFLLISVILWCYLIPNTIKGGGGNIASDSTLFPKVFTLCLGAVSVILMVLGIKECLKRRQFICKNNVREELARLFLADSPALIVFAVLSVMFCMAAPAAGFFSTGFVIMAAAAFYLGNRGFLWVIVYPALFMTLLWLVFATLLSVKFPSGILI